MPQKEHTFTKFDDELNAIRALVLEMSRLVEIQFGQAFIALFESSTSIARDVIDLDYSVNQLDIKIDNLCVNAIACQQPAASDLQAIMRSSKVIVHLERIGDAAKNIARIAERLSLQKNLPAQRLFCIRHVAELAQLRLAALSDSLVHLDAGAARNLMDSEDMITTEFHSVFRTIVQSMADDPRIISSALDLLFIAKSIEGIGSHITHIAQLIIDASDRYNDA